jgi:hypothetical protein
LKVECNGLTPGAKGPGHYKYLKRELFYVIAFLVFEGLTEWPGTGGEGAWPLQVFKEGIILFIRFFGF